MGEKKKPATVKPAVVEAREQTAGSVELDQNSAMDSTMKAQRVKTLAAQLKQFVEEENAKAFEQLQKSKEKETEKKKPAAVKPAVVEAREQTAGSVELDQNS